MPTSPRPSAPERRARDRSYDELRTRVFMAFVRTTAAATGIMAIGEVFVRGPLAWQTAAFAMVSAVFTGAAFYFKRTQQTRVATVVSLGIYSVVFFLLELASPIPAVGIRVGTFAFPVAVVLLVSRRAAVGFYLVAAIQALALTPYTASDNVGLAVLHAVGSVFVGAILLAIAWVFDHARQTASLRAQAREDELTIALRRAEAAAEARTNFLASMSHEIRTPMNGVLGLSRLLVDEATDPAQRDLAQTVVSSGVSLLQILDDILDLSKLDAGALEIDPGVEAPRTIVRDVVALLATRAQDGGLYLRVDVDDAVPEHVVFDGHRFRQVLSNLVGNALKFTTEGGVAIRVGYRDGVLRCEVEDTGIGIACDKIPRLFRAFSQAETGTARRFGGTGLGLAICKRLADLMGGRIGVHSEPGKGSTFWLELPAPEAEERSEPSADVLPPLVPMHVLVAEDNRVNQLVIRRFLERLGVRAEVVEDGAQAVERATDSAFDLILMDWHMPHVDGIEATQRIRRGGGAGRHTPIVALTASVMAGDRATCLDAGMNDVLAKPIDMKQLEAVLRRHAPAPT